MNALKRLCTSLAVTSLLAGLVATAPAVVLADGSLNWNTINGANACDGDTTGTVLWIFNPHSDAVPTELYINGVAQTDADHFWTQSGGSQNWHFTALIPGTFDDIINASVTYTGTRGDNPVFTISGCNEGGGRQQAADLTIVKDAAGTYDRECDWSISKDVDRTSVEISGGTATFNYTVSVSATCDRIEAATVTGKITVFNPNAGDVVIDSLTDELSDLTVCTVSPDPTGATIPANGSSDFTYTCDVSGYDNLLGNAPPGDLVNTATVSWSHQILSDNSELSAGSTFFDFDVVFTETLTDDCVDVTDTLDEASNSVGEYCVPDGSGGSHDFLYSRVFSAPARSICVDHNNTASFEDNSTPQNVGDSNEVTVTICNFAQALTPGYWKTHLANSASSGPWTDASCGTAALKLTGGGCSKNGVWTKQYLPISLNGYSVDTILKAAQVFAKMNCSSTKDNDAVGCLAGHLLATKLNVANGSNPCINAVITQADNFLTSIGYTGTGPSGTYSLTKAERAAVILLKNALDKYNNGGGC